MIVNLPRGLKINLDNVPEDFESMVQKAFSEYAEGTAKEYMFQDKLAFIDRSIVLLHGDKPSYEAIMDLMKDYLEGEVREYGNIPDKTDYLSPEFMENCYIAGVDSQRMYSRYGVGRHDEEKIERLLLRLIKAVIEYQEKPQVSSVPTCVSCRWCIKEDEHSGICGLRGYKGKDPIRMYFEEQGEDPEAIQKLVDGMISDLNTVPNWCPRIYIDKKNRI